MDDKKAQHVFISYVRENQEVVDRLCTALREKGIKVWLDRDSIQPGIFWKDAIRQAIEEGAFFIACFSREYSERQRTHMNEELNLAIEELRKRPRGQAWFIPVVLSGEVPNWDIGAGKTLGDIQQVRLFEDWENGIKRIISVIGKIDIPKLRITKPDEIHQTQEFVKVSGDGAIPGNAIILITSLSDKHIAPQKARIISDGNGNWEHPGCRLLHTNWERLVYALSIKPEDEDEVRQLLEERKSEKTEEAMLKFSKYLDENNISHQLSQAVVLIRKDS